MSKLRYRLAHSNHWSVRGLKSVYREAARFSVPAPRIVVKPMLWAFLSCRTIYHFMMRAFICEPLFKAYCKRYGRRLRTGVYVHWIKGRGDIILGDDVKFDGKSGITFAARYTENPTLEVGDGSGIAHGCTLIIGKRITIGKKCMIASGVRIFDSSGHPSNLAARLAGDPAAERDVRPVTIGDNVWIGANSVVFPGVTIGDGSVVSASSVVMSDVPPGVIVAGNPARKISVLVNSPKAAVAG